MFWASRAFPGVRPRVRKFAGSSSFAFECLRPRQGDRFWDPNTTSKPRSLTQIMVRYRRLDGALGAHRRSVRPGRRPSRLKQQVRFKIEVPRQSLGERACEAKAASKARCLTITLVIYRDFPESRPKAFKLEGSTLIHMSRPSASFAGPHREPKSISTPQYLTKITVINCGWAVVSGFPQAVPGTGPVIFLFRPDAREETSLRSA